MHTGRETQRVALTDTLTRPPLLSLARRRRAKKNARRRRAQNFEALVLLQGAASAGTAIAASVSPTTRESSCMSTRAEQWHGGQQTARLSEAGWSDAGGSCSQTVESVILSTMVSHTCGSSTALSLLG